MRVLIHTFEFVPFAGGIATYVREVAAGLTAHGCDVRVLAPDYHDVGDLDSAAPWTTTRMGFFHGGPELLRFIPGARGLWSEIDSFRPDVVLLASDLAHGIGGLLCPLRGVPFVPVVHGSEVVKHFPPSTGKERFQALPLAHCYRRAQAVVGVSGYVRGLLAAAGFDETELHVIHNGIDADLVKRPRDGDAVARVRESLGLGDAPVVLTVSRLVERKGQASMIRALPAVLERHPRVRYVIAGRGPDRELLEQLASELGVASSVVFAGAVSDEDKLALLDACDVYVLPSFGDGRRVEGLGIALLEAGARGKPLVGGRHGGVPEIVEDGVTGYLVDGRDPADLASRVLDLLDRPGFARSVGDAAKEKVEQGFLTDHMTERLLGLLRSVAGRGSSAAELSSRGA